MIMTGRIKALSLASASGLIEAENGLRIPFESASVLAYDVAHLCIGQLVTFVVDDGVTRRAINICVQKTPHISSDEARKGGVFRYVGFDQSNAIRTFRFERAYLGEAPELFTVSTDLALLAKYHVTLQEGPALCLRILTVGLDVAGGAPLQRALTEQDLLTHVASRPGPGARHQKRPARPSPTPAM
jgi:hypothetical protein